MIASRTLRHVLKCFSFSVFALLLLQFSDHVGQGPSFVGTANSTTLIQNPDKPKKHPNAAKFNKAKKKMEAACSDKPAADQKECLTDGRVALLNDSKLSGWSTGDLDPDHPDYDAIIEGQIDALDQAMNGKKGERGEKDIPPSPSIVDMDIKLEIKNEPKMDNGKPVPADTTTTYTMKNGKQIPHTVITFYNTPPLPPPPPGGGQESSGDASQYQSLVTEKLLLAQYGMVLNQFTAKDFLDLTMRHEIAHAKMAKANTRWPNAKVEEQWLALWLAASTDYTGIPDQLYDYDLPGTLFDYWYAFLDSPEEGFAVAMSYFETGRTFANADLWNFVSTFDETYLQDYSDWKADLDLIDLRGFSSSKFNLQLKKRPYPKIP